MDIYNFNDYKEFVRLWCAAERGQFRKLAEFLQIQTSLISQIFSGDRNLTLEQACTASAFFKFNKSETHYFINLVQLERAGTESLKSIIRADLKRIRSESRSGKEVRVVPSHEILDEAEQSMFYSQWFFSAIRIATSIDGLKTRDALAAHLNLPRETIEKAVQFLLKAELCIEENGKLKMAVKATRVDQDSLFAARMHTNWRMKACEKLSTGSSKGTFRSRVISLSAADFTAIQKLLLVTLDAIDKRVDPSHPEKLACLNLDWFEI